MTPEEVIDTCAAMGIYLRVEAGKLKAAPPPAPPLLDKLRLHRDAVIARLEGMPSKPPMASPNPRGASAQRDMIGRFTPISGKRIGGIGGTPHIQTDASPSTQLNPPMPPIDFPEPAERYAPAHRLPGPLCDPVDLAERTAILEANGVSRDEAEALALTETGFPSWDAYAVALAAQLKAKIEAAQAPSSGPLVRHWQALARNSLSFLASPWWPLACQCGWVLAEVFGVDCDAALARVDGWGLAVAPALSSLPPTRLVQLTCEGAVFATQSGNRLSWPRFRGQLAERSCARRTLLTCWPTAHRRVQSAPSWQLDHCALAATLAAACRPAQHVA
jgi:hypothetical protein